MSSNNKTSRLRPRIGWEAGIFVGLFALTVLTVFWKPLFSGETLWGPDNLPHGSIERKDELPGAFMGSWHPMMLGLARAPLPLTPVNLLRCVTSPLVFHVGAYLFNISLLGLAGLYFLRGRGLRGIPAYCGAMALALSPHSFTLIAAGHLGKFSLMSMVPLMLGLLDRAVERQSLKHYAWAGAVAAFGLGAQPDIMLIFAILAGLYWAYRLAASCFLPGLRRVATKGIIGAAIATAFALALGYASIRGAQQHSMKTRSEVAGKSEKEKWIFATNWSLPPEEAIEFVAPCFFGVETGDPKGPYWGRMGRALGWMKHKQGLMNLRQHTVYLGVLPITFGFLALAWAVTTRGRGRDDDDEVAQEVRRRLRRDVIFWSVIALLAFLFALGRNFPLYRLFYALPYAGSMRAPVKFLHVLEVALGFLFAAGLSITLGHVAASRQTDKAGPEAASFYRWGFWGATCMAALMMIGMLGVGALRSSLTAYWTELGLAGSQSVIVRNMLRGLLQAAILFGVCAAALRFMGRSRDPARTGRWVAAMVLVCLALDLALVNRRYVKVVDLSAFMRSNSLIERLHQEVEPYRVSCPFPGSPFAQWRSIMFRAHLIDALEPPKQRNMESDYQAYFGAFQQNPLRLWELTNTRFVVGPMQALQSLLNAGQCQLVHAFDIDARGRIIDIGQRAAGRFALVRFTRALPRALVYHKWLSLDDDNAVLSSLAGSELNPQEWAILSGPPGRHDTGRGPTAVTSLEHDRTLIRIRVEIPEEGLLVVNDRYQDGWTATVDGRPQAIDRVNYLMRGLKLGAGKHEIVMTYQPYRGHFFLAVGALLVLSAWSIAAIVIRRVRPATP